MALRIKQPKNRDADREHPAYMSGQQQTWADKDRERTQGSFRRNFIAIIAVIVLIAVVLIVAAVSAVIPAVTGTNQISAADTFAISQVEQQKMKQDATTFAQGLLVYSYCSDQATAFEGKNAALALMANNTGSYAEVSDMAQISPIVAPENLVPLVRNVRLETNTQAYAGDYVVKLEAIAADSSVTTGGEAGTFVDRGCEMTITFGYATDSNTGEGTWVIKSAIVDPIYESL